MKNDCKIIDIRSDFLMQTDYLVNYSDDGIHPNAQGHEIICGALTDYAQEIHAF